MIRIFRKSTPAARPASLPAPGGGGEAAEARWLRAREWLKRIAPLALEEEQVFALQIRAWADSPVADEEQWTRLTGRIRTALERSRSRQDEMAMLVGKLRDALDSLQLLVALLPEGEGTRWRRWLADAAESVNQARPHDDTDGLRSLLVEVRDGQSALRSRLPQTSPPEPDAEWGLIRTEARRLLDQALDLARRLPAEREVSLRQRLERLQRQFSEVMDLRDARSARVLLLHLEDTVEDTRHALAAAEGPPTVVDHFPARDPG